MSLPNSGAEIIYILVPPFTKVRLFRVLFSKFFLTSLIIYYPTGFSFPKSTGQEDKYRRIHFTWRIGEIFIWLELIKRTYCHFYHYPFWKIMTYKTRFRKEKKWKKSKCEQIQTIDLSNGFA